MNGGESERDEAQRLGWATSSQVENQITQAGNLREETKKEQADEQSKAQLARSKRQRLLIKVSQKGLKRS